MLHHRLSLPRVPRRRLPIALLRSSSARLLFPLSAPATLGLKQGHDGHDGTQYSASVGVGRSGSIRLGRSGSPRARDRCLRATGSRRRSNSGATAAAAAGPRGSRILFADELLRRLDAAGIAQTRREIDGRFDVVLAAVLLQTAGDATKELLVAADAGNVGGRAASNVGPGDVGADTGVLSTTASGLVYVGRRVAAKGKGGALQREAVLQRI